MTYDTPEALRIALEQRLLTQSNESGINLERLRRRVVFERTIARLHTAEPGQWVLKGGMALEVRLRDDARLTKDLDLGVRSEVTGAESLQERLIDALAVDPFDDHFTFTVKPASQLMEEGAGQPTWRTKLAASLAGRLFWRSPGTDQTPTPGPTAKLYMKLAIC
jgi:Nucleotidyl transferase AbiEii toxin, Type IV TA system